MRGNALAPQENLDGPRRQPHLDFAAGEAVGHAVKVSLDLDVVIDAERGAAAIPETRPPSGHRHHCRGEDRLWPHRPSMMTQGHADSADVALCTIGP